MSILDKMGYDKISNNPNPITAMMENANMMSEILCEEIDIEFSTQIIEAAYAEGFNPYGEGLFENKVFGGVRSMAKDAKSYIGRGWQFIKDMIKKVIDMIKNILKDFFAAEKQVGKLLNDCKKALNERVRDIKDQNKSMKVIAFNSLSELGIPIHEATRGSYSAKLLLMCNLLEKASTQRHAQQESFNDYTMYGEAGENNTTDNNNGQSGGGNGKSEDGEDVDTTGQNTGNPSTVDDETNDGYKKFKEDISNANPDYSNQTKDGKASEVAPDLKDYRNFVMAEVKGGTNMSNRDWADLLNEMAKVVNHRSRDFLDVAPGMITFVAREMYSYGLYSNKRIKGNEKERKAQEHDMNLQKLRKFRLKAPDVYMLTSNMLRDFVELYTELQKQKLSTYFKNKQNALNTLSSKLDRLQQRVNDNNRDGKSNLNNQRGATPLVNQGRQNNTNNNTNTTTGNNNANANNTNQGSSQSADYIELLSDIQNYSPYGEGIFSGSNTSTNTNTDDQKTDNPNNNGQNVQQDEDTNNLIEYVRAYIVGTSQGLMQAASFYNSILKKWNEACRSTIVAYYAVTSNDKKTKDLKDFNAPNTENGQNNNQDEDIPTWDSNNNNTQ